MLTNNLQDLEYLSCPFTSGMDTVSNHKIRVVHLKIAKLFSIANTSLPLTLNMLVLLQFLGIIISLFNQATSLSFNFSSFDPNDRKITYRENASSSNGFIYLTTDHKEIGSERSLGRAIFHDPLLLWEKASGNLTDFSTNFSFVIVSNGTGCRGDGLTFFLADQSLQTNVTDAGGGLGLVHENEPSKYPFVAVEFDTFLNEWEPNYSEKQFCNDDEHVGIDINSVVSNATMSWNASDAIRAGMENIAQIMYESSTKNLSVKVKAINAIVFQELSYVIDLRDYLPEYVSFGFSASTGSLTEIFKIKSWNFSSSLEVKDSSKKKKVTAGLAVGLSIACVLVVLALLCFFICLKRLSKGNKADKVGSQRLTEGVSVVEVGSQIVDLDKIGKGAGPKQFQYNDLATATNNFSVQQKIGEGGFGPVYKGFLKDLNSYVAVKRVSPGSNQGVKEYASEVQIISQLRHRNLVQLVGWCHEQVELLLVYEFMPNGSLDSYLFKGKGLLTWEVRYKITKGLASGLLYLHEECIKCVIHRDIKSSNVLLDSDFNAKLGDFGLSRLVEHEKGSQITDIIAGTEGYAAPEFVQSGKASRESDVYSFGIVALEIASGKYVNSKANEDGQSVVQWIWELYGNERLLEAADPLLRGIFDEDQMKLLLIVGLWCAHPDQNLRPSIRRAIQVLSGEAPLPALPVLKMPQLPVIAQPSNVLDRIAKGGQNQFSSNNITASSHCTTSSTASTSATLQQPR